MFKYGLRQVGVRNLNPFTNRAHSSRPITLNQHSLIVDLTFIQVACPVGYLCYLDIFMAEMINLWLPWIALLISYLSLDHRA